ncbi:MAG: hypothetical protein QOI76_1536 [Frankiales bacterium]|jgi:uncharacterized protein YndB with AHSA1/START domain/DNA-binding transcriptional ArsR family regulator|nr:hypothetical protein [Frankiales bacterium]
MQQLQDTVFRALADPTRRLLLDRLHQENGQTLGELCSNLGMARQSATQHLALLEDAGLVSTARRGRSKLHYLNPVPLHEISERWIDKFERPRLQALSQVRRRAEDQMTDRPSFVYVTYIRSTPERVWEALTDADLTAEYWGHSNVSDWQVGSQWEHQRTDSSREVDVAGVVLEAKPADRLVITFGPPGEPPTKVTFEIESYGAIVRLTVTHEDLPSDEDAALAAHGWSAVLSNLKSLLETGHALPEAPWEMAQR